MSAQYRSVTDPLSTGQSLPVRHATSDEHGSAVSWGAVLAGAAGAAALSLILLILGTGLGLSSVSPWAQTGVTATALGVSAIVWLAFTQLAASGVGGYLAGRLRKKWVNVHTDESYFRDTAHGFLAWAIATLATAALLGSVIGSIISGGVQASAATMGVAATSSSMATAMNPESEGQNTGYLVDSLFRRDTSGAVTPNTTDITGAVPTSSPTSLATSNTEVTRIFIHSIGSDVALPVEDLRYVGQVVAQRTGISQPDAEKRVAQVYDQMQAKVRDAKVKAKSAADEARKTSAYTALWLFISLLLGAFVASLAATFGGRQRDL